MKICEDETCMSKQSELIILEAKKLKEDLNNNKGKIVEKFSKKPIEGGTEIPVGGNNETIEIVQLK